MLSKKKKKKRNPFISVSFFLAASRDEGQKKKKKMSYVVFLPFVPADSQKKQNGLRLFVFSFFSWRAFSTRKCDPFGRCLIRNWLGQTHWIVTDTSEMAFCNNKNMQALHRHNKVICSIVSAEEFLEKRIS